MAQTIFKNWFVIGVKSKGQKTKLGDVVELAYGKALKEENRSGGNVVVVGSSGIVGKHNEQSPTVLYCCWRKGVAGVSGLMKILPDRYDLLRKNRITDDFLLFLAKESDLISGDSAVPGLNREDACRIESNCHAVQLESSKYS